MDQNTLEKAKEMFQKAADELGLTLVSTRYYVSKEDGPVLEVLIDRDFEITMDEIDTSEEGYVLDISSGGSQREIPFDSLERFLSRWLDVKLKKNGDVILMQLDKVENGKAFLHHFIKGRKKNEVLTEDDVDSIHMGYKA